MAEGQNVAAAFGLVIGAGMCTTIGAAAVFFPTLAKLGNRRNLASALGLSAGVMTYISFVDIYQKAIDGFEENGHDKEKSFIYATVTFFCGCILMMILDGIIAVILKVSGQDMPDTEHPEVLENPSGQDEDDEVVTELSPSVGKPETGEKKKHLINMGAATALSIAIHNFPEGLVTFVGYMEDPAVGIALAVGIGIHNIPEGLCVSMPIYYATGNKWKAFGWGVLSGLTEPLGALIGWAAFNNSFSGNAYGIMFGLVGGIMTMIALDGLLPTAHRFDPEGGKRITFFVLLGMGVVALSLVLFAI